MATPSNPGARRQTPSSSGNRLICTFLLVGLVTTVCLALATHLSLKAATPVTPVQADDQLVGDAKAQAKQTAEAAGERLVIPPAGSKMRVVVVGGGLAGCTAALSVQASLQAHWATSGTAPTNTSPSEPQVEVVLVEKTPKLGGNSAKASSGINALNPPAGDSQELFEQDTLKSGGDRSKPQLVSTLVAQSLDAIEFLQGQGVDLTKVTQLGGHSVPRSRTNPVGGNVGWSIMAKMMQAVRDAGVKVMEGHKLTQLVVSDEGAVTGVLLSAAAKEAGAAPDTVLLPAQAVILAAGGFGANRTLLRQHCPEAAELATTNGPWAQGDVLDVAAQAGATLRDLDQVQIHPTGFVDPKDPASGTKFLAPEKLRGVGAILLNKEGKRFVDELTTRDKASDAVMRQTGKEVYLVLSETAATEYGMSAVGFYASKGLMVKVEGVAGLAEHTGVEQAVLAQQLQNYNAARDGKQADEFGKTVFPAGFDESGPMYVARITPVVHYTMGGVEIDTQARALNQAGQPIPGLYAAGEVSGGVHGRNRLGGNSLLECVVYGKIAGQQAAQQLLGSKQAVVAAAL